MMKKYAKELLNNDLLRNFFIELENELTEKWKACKSCDDREELFLKITVLRLLMEYIYGESKHIAESGKSPFKR